MKLMKKKGVVLVILDGWGQTPIWGGNAVGLASTPFFDYLSSHFPFITLEASGEAVGLPFGERGNSEVGHLNLGTGHPVSQGLSQINQKIKSGEFFQNPVLKRTITNSQKNLRALHLIGLVSDGGIHSHINHLFALLELIKQHNHHRVYLHFITDGRDTPPTAAFKFLNQVEEKMQELETGTIATVLGRYFAMDRDQNWNRLEKAYDALVSGVGNKALSAREAILQAYSQGITDEFIPPTIIHNTSRLQNGDSIIFFNYRSDRARELSLALLEPHFSGFKRKKVLEKLTMAAFGSYQESLPLHIVFQEEKIFPTLCSILSDHQLTHLHIAETEKYAHVTYFFNGGQEKPFPGEKRVLIPSYKTKSYALYPQMRAKEITQKALRLIPQFDFSVINYANPDMVGHTGDLSATVKAVEQVDRCLKKLISFLLPLGFTIMVTADHGNAEQMINPLTGQPDTEHTTSPVPLILVSKNKFSLHYQGKLIDVASSILKLFQIKKPSAFVGESLI
jgi:2,3-bisphosphoglycerate-independent phosphoglycerate mutase